MEAINAMLEKIAGLVWNYPLIILLAGTGILLTIYLQGVQFKYLKHIWHILRGKFDNPNDPGEITHFQALCTALSATVGLGNIAGVAVAIKLGGPGAVFWMILIGLLGMATKFAEASLALMYRKIDSNGEVHGGPMYYITLGLGSKFKFLAQFFAVACIFATFGAGNMFQSNSVAQLLATNFQTPPLWTGIILSLLVGVVILGGIKRIGSISSKLLPFMGGIYIIASLFVIITHFDALPSLIATIFHDAFNGTAMAGGITGIALRTVIVQGIRRACFSNEAGLGSAAIAHSAASTNEPIREGLVASIGPFIDTVVICTMTALVILISGVWVNTDLSGVALTAKAFDSTIQGFGLYFMPVAVSLFAYSTLLSWSYYGERSLDFLFKGKGIFVYRLFYIAAVFLGAIWKLMPILNFSDIMLGLMVVPNLIAVLLLLPKIKTASVKYFNSLKNGEFKTYS
ncbi:MAG: sodium:alanine symporter family protein [Bdellovibrionaceae bacterium]|nr:sodium:alanine symporter family protein [Pseudobdellovibrionaceae bacterium]